MNCTCTHPDCPSHADNIRQTLLAEVQRIAPDAKPFGTPMAWNHTFQSEATGVTFYALLSCRSEGRWEWMASILGKGETPAAALDALRTIAAGVCP